MRERGFTLLEVLVVMALIGAMAAFAYPRLGDAITKQNVRSARVAVVGQFAKARATAIQRGARTSLILKNDTLYVQSVHPVTGAIQRVGSFEDLRKRYGVDIQPERDTCTYDPRGIAMEAGDLTVTVTKGAYSATIVVNAVGRVIQ